jgi:hypothetical protein
MDQSQMPLDADGGALPDRRKLHDVLMESSPGTVTRFPGSPNGERGEDRPADAGLSPEDLFGRRQASLVSTRGNARRIWEAWAKPYFASRS